MEVFSFFLLSLLCVVTHLSESCPSSLAMKMLPAKCHILSPQADSDQLR